MPGEGRGLSSRPTQDVVRDLRLGHLATPKSVQKLQTALHAKAKAEAGYRFYTLYDKISRDDVLAHAYAQCRSNRGAPGIDGQDFADIEAYGVERWLTELALALRQETYRPEPIRRVFIPKANGKLRPLGISTVRDRVCMTAAMLVLEPIFEADLPPEIYAYRAGRNAQQAAVEVEELLFRGHPDVVDADLADYFGSIPHTDLLKSVARRIVDRRVLHLIKMWLDCPVEEADERGQDTDLQGPGRRVRLLGIHVRTNVLSNNGPGPVGSATVKEEHPAHGRNRPRADRPRADLARDHRARRQVEPRAPRVGQLLQRRLHQQGVSRARHIRGCAVAPVVAVQAQGQATQARELSTLAPLRVLWARTSDPARPRPVVGEGVRSCPRAQCGKSACCVR